MYYGPPTYGRAKAGRPARTYIQQLCEDTGCNPKDLPEAMSDREKWRERVRDIRADGTTWWWWYIVKQQILYGTRTFSDKAAMLEKIIYSLFVKRSIFLVWRCPRCSRYRRRKWIRRHEFKSWTRLIAFSHSTNTLGEGMNPIILPPAMGK